MALVSGLLAGIMLPDPREKSRTGLIPCKGIFLLIYFLQKHNRSRQIPACTITQESFSLSQEVKKLLRSQINSDEAIKQNGN